MEPENNKEENLTDPFKELQNKLDACLKERDEYLNGWKRAKADLINYQKDETKRFDDLLKFGSIDFIKDLIPVLDSFAALKRNIEGEPRPDSVAGRDLSGVFMIQSQMEDVLKKRGLERIAVKIGQNFEPSIHESISEGESDQPIGSIIEEIEHGYMLNGRVVRPARVKLSKGN